MIRPARGQTIILISPVILAFLTLAGCATMLSQRQAMSYATARLNRFCDDSGPCEPRHVIGAQRLQGGWLVEFDAANARYGVMVHDDRYTDVSIWNKSVPQSSSN